MSRSLCASLELRPAGFDRETGDLHLADVGQSILEKVNLHSAAVGSGRGMNFGWRCREGNYGLTSTTATPCGAGDSLSFVVLPVHQYSPAGGRCSITGGAAVDLTDRTAELKPSDAPNLGKIASFGEDAFGELYICDIGGNVYKIVPADQTAVRPGEFPGLGRAHRR